MIVMTKMDIALNITLHNEGDLLYKTFQSVALNVNALKEEYPKLKVQANVSLDCPDDYTKQFFTKSKHFLADVVDELRHYIVNFADPALSRNYLIDKALASKVKYIQTYDGDDLFSTKYLLRMYQRAEEAGKPVVVEPEFMLDMDEWSGLCRTDVIRKFLASNDPHQSITSMYATNLYQSHIFVSSIFQKIKYTANGGRYRYEDYHILLEMIASGYDILVAPGTVEIYRRKLADSVLSEHNANHQLCLAPSRFFTPAVFRSLNHRSVNELNEPSKQLDTPVVTSGQWKDDENQYIKIHRSSARNVLLYGKRLLIETARSVKQAGRLIRSQKGVNHKLSVRELKELNLERLNKAGINQEMFDDIKKLNKIEPLATYDTAGFINAMPVYTMIHPSSLNDVYYRLCSVPDIDKTTDLLLIPHLTKGGADKAMVELCQALSEHGRRVLAIGTNVGDESPWRDRLNELPGVIFLERNEYFPLDQIGDKDLEIMLLRMIQNWPKLERLTVMNSGVGYNLINERHDGIKRHVQIIIHGWSYGINDCGLMFETTILSKIYRYIDCLITDGGGYKKQLAEINGWDGFLVDDNGNAKAYLEAILKFYDQSDQLLSPDERKEFNQKILHEHDRAIYQKHIGEVYGW